MDEADEFHPRGSGYKVLSFQPNIMPLEEGLDDGGPGGRSADTVLFQGIAQFVVVHQTTCSLHGAQERGFCVRFGWLCPFFGQVRNVGAAFTFRENRERAFFLGVFSQGFRRLGLLCIHLSPTRQENLFAGCFERDVGRFAEDGGGGEFAVGVERCNETPRHEVEYPLFVRCQAVRCYSGGDNGMVVGDFGRVEHLFTLFQRRATQGLEQGGIFAGYAVEDGVAFRINVVAQESGVHTRISRDFLLVERLDELQGQVGRERKLAVAFHL